MQSISFFDEGLAIGKVMQTGNISGRRDSVKRSVFMLCLCCVYAVFSAPGALWELFPWSAWSSRI
jgi:hypothetical protein